jgi:murein DD-endopeptidase MepM/ murein hydrolase activator NlpD
VSAGTAPSGKPGQTPEQLRALAAEFESLLLGQMLRGMRESMFDSGDGGSDSTGFGGGPLGDTLFSELSLAISRAGGLGLGQTLMAPLLAQSGGAGYSGDLTAALGAGMNGVTVPQLDPEPGEAPGASLSEGLPGRISSGYGWRRDPIAGDRRFHQGIDLAVPIGSDVPAARGGTVSFAGDLPGYGLTVVINHDARLATRYAHLSALDVRAGDEVAAGQTIAQSGATGRATGPHLHFEVLEDGKPVDPTPGWPADRR